MAVTKSTSVATKHTASTLARQRAFKPYEAPGKHSRFSQNYVKQKQKHRSGSVKGKGTGKGKGEVKKESESAVTTGLAANTAVIAPPVVPDDTANSTISNASVDTVVPATGAGDDTPPVSNSDSNSNSTSDSNSKSNSNSDSNSKSVNDIAVHAKVDLDGHGSASSPPSPPLDREAIIKSEDEDGVEDQVKTENQIKAERVDEDGDKDDKNNLTNQSETTTTHLKVKVEGESKVESDEDGINSLTNQSKDGDLGIKTEDKDQPDQADSQSVINKFGIANLEFKSKDGIKTEEGENTKDLTNESESESTLVEVKTEEGDDTESEGEKKGDNGQRVNTADPDLDNQMDNVHFITGDTSNQTSTDSERSFGSRTTDDEIEEEGPVSDDSIEDDGVEFRSNR